MQKISRLQQTYPIFFSDLRWNCLWFGFLVVSLGTSVEGQPPPRATGGLGIRSTNLQVEVLSRTEGAAVHAQEWGRIFENLGVDLVIRRGLAEDRPELEESVLGTLRTVKLIGRLERDGELVFPGKSYRKSDVAALKEWLKELQTYGAQGTPSGKPLWGLSKEQFEKVFAGLAIPVKADLEGKTLPAAIEQLGLPPELPIRWTTAAETQFRQLGVNNTVRQRTHELSAGTVLAVLLNDRGFGVKPNRTPNGELELVVDITSADPMDQWPIGWPTQKQIPELLPGLFKIQNISFQRQPLFSLLATAREATSVPMFIDYSAMERADINPDQLALSHLLKKTTWSLALRSTLVPQKLNREYWQDEGGRGFVLITTIGPSRRQHLSEDRGK